MLTSLPVDVISKGGVAGSCGNLEASFLLQTLEWSLQPSDNMVGYKA
jgi:hypothetical protein